MSVKNKTATRAPKPKQAGKTRPAAPAVGEAKRKKRSQPEAAPAEAKPETDAGPPAPRAAKADAQPGKLSALGAAARVLQEAGTAMSCQAMVDAMAAQGYWTSPGGKTPAATISAAILREIRAKGPDARFRKTERGKFAAAGVA